MSSESVNSVSAESVNSMSAESVNLHLFVVIFLVPVLGSQAAHDFEIFLCLYRAWLVSLPYGCLDTVPAQGIPKDWEGPLCPLHECRSEDVSNWLVF